MNIVIEDFNIYYEKYGNGKKNILILPGWGDTRTTFKSMINYLEKEYTIYILDYPGFGNSSFPNRNLSVYDYASMIKVFIDVLSIDNPIIIAHSFGARLSLILNGKLNVKIDKLIIIDGAGIKGKKKLSSIIKTYFYKALKSLRYLLPKKLRKKYLGMLIDIFGSQDYKSLSDNMKKTFSNIVNEDLSYLLKNINAETLLIWGENDEDTPLSDGIIMHENIKDSGLIVIKKGTHFAYLNAPLYVNSIILNFIKS